MECKRRGSWQIPGRAIISCAQVVTDSDRNSSGAWEQLWGGMRRSGASTEEGGLLYKRAQRLDVHKEKEQARREGNMGT